MNFAHLDDYEPLDKIKTECDTFWKDEMPEFLLRNNSLILKHVIHSNIELFINFRYYFFRFKYGSFNLIKND